MARDPLGSPGSSPAPPSGATFKDVLQRRIGRRGIIRAGIVASALATTGLVLDSPPARSLRAQVFQDTRRLAFRSVLPNLLDHITIAEGYRSQVLLSWGDPLFAYVPPFDIGAQTAALQERRFGFNNDFLAFLPLPLGSENPHEGLLWANHEYTDGLLMFPGYDAQNPTLEQVNVELAAHGGSVVHVRGNSVDGWTYDPHSRYNRRITASTPMRLSGPAAGDPLLRTMADPTGTLVLGMLGNCSGGITPWGTVLTCEENFNQYFAFNAKLPANSRRRTYHRHYSVADDVTLRRWERYYSRFDVEKDPHEPFRFGWVVEIDPYDPGFQPVKRTALGRIKHEAAAVALAPSGQVVVYSGDDEAFQCAYKFVSAGTYAPNNRSANFGLLDTGTLYAARFHDDGSGQWLPLVYGQSPLTPANGWASQADVCIRTREAAAAVGATLMDRPEDFEPNPVTGKVYLVMTNNLIRGALGQPGVNAANPRPANAFGHIVEITENGDDPSALTFRWEIFLLAGDPKQAGTYFAGFPKDQVSAIANPDNIAFDSQGNMWIATDGQPFALRANDGIYAVPTEGPERGQVRQLLSAVRGAEVTGLMFTPGSETLFAAIQHPGEGGSLAAPISTWPHEGRGPARPSVIAVTRQDGGPIGS